MLSSIKARLLATHLLIAAVATLAASLFLFESFSKLQVRYHEQLLLASAYALADVLETDLGTTHGDTLVKHALGKMADEEIAEFAVFDSHGRLLSATANPSASEYNSEDVAIALTSETHTVKHARKSQVNERVIVFVPMERANKVVGVVRAWISDDDYESSLNYIRMITLLTIAGVGTLSIIIALLLARALITPIRRMRALSQLIAKGNFETRVDSYGSDELAQLAIDLNTMASRLQGLENTRREFIGNVSHDLRSPVSNIRITSEVLERRAEKLGDDSAKLFRIVVLETERLERMIDELMELSAIESGKLVLHKEVFTVRQLLEELVQVANRQAEEKHLTIGILADPEHKVVADRDRLGRAIMNILDNAIKFTPSGGQVVVSARIDGFELIIEVSDTGIGIPAGDIGKVFERFYRTDKARSQKGGTGIGLAIVKYIIDAHEGKVEVRSKEGRGSTFIITLPLHNPLFVAKEN
ncbi:MAG: sensor histidine kinase [Armatimonadota bacterium]